MVNRLKKTSTLFHSTKKFTNIKNILINTGFKASYGDEKIDDLEVKILMVSFSNIALFEAKSQINYGDYAIGLTKEWGIKNSLEPVIYTYDASITGSTFMENLKISGRTLYDTKLPKPLQHNIETLLDNSVNNLQYFKQHIVKNNKGQEFIAYNDREWRYIHKHDKYNSIIFKFSFLNRTTPNKDYDRHKPFTKPYTQNTVLHYELEDIKFIIVKNKKQKEAVFNILAKNYGKEKIINHLIKGELDILSRDVIWDNL